jgi:CHAD domain-containing protein
MAYRLSAGQPVSDEVRRILFEEIDFARNQLTKHKDKDRDESIHEARKSIKKLRGLLRLIKPLIGGETYQRENQHLRDVGRNLSELRDTRAIIEIFEAVVKEAEPQELLADEVVQSIRSRLEAHKSETEQNLNIDQTLGSAVSALDTLREQVNDYQLNGQGFESLERGLKNTYCRGRKAMSMAEKTPTPEEFHNWRKRVKDHWYHVRLLSDLNTAFINTREDDLKKLETWLGDDHNLVVLRETIDKDRAGFGHPKQIRHFLAITKKHGQELRAKAKALGERLYKPKPKQFLKELVGAREIWPTLDASANGDQQLADSSKSRTAKLETTAIHSNDERQPRKKVVSVPSQRSRAKKRA